MHLAVDDLPTWLLKHFIHCKLSIEAVSYQYSLDVPLIALKSAVVKLKSPPIFGFVVSSA